MADNRTLSVVKEFGSLINTGLIIVAGCGLFYSWGADNKETNSRILANTEAISKLVLEDARRWETHGDLHRERNGEINKREGSVDQRLSQIEDKQETDSRKFENGIYRIGILEDARKGDAAIIRDVQKTVTDLAGDMKVVLREIQQTKGVQ